MYCSKCGNKLPEDSCFCSFCGAELSEERAINNSTTSVSEEVTKLDKKGKIIVLILFSLAALGIMLGIGISHKEAKGERPIKQHSETLSKEAYVKPASNAEDILEKSDDGAEPINSSEKPDKSGLESSTLPITEEPKIENNGATNKESVVESTDAYSFLVKKVQEIGAETSTSFVLSRRISDSTNCSILYYPHNGNLCFSSSTVLTTEGAKLSDEGAIWLDNIDGPRFYSIKRSIMPETSAWLSAQGMGNVEASSFSENTHIVFASYTGDESLRQGMEDSASATLATALIGAQIIMIENEITNISIADFGFTSINF